METRAKRRKTAGETSSSSPPPPPVPRSWSDLPHDLLLPIFIHLSLSIPDLLTFAAVCRAWRAIAAAFIAADPSPFLRPPMLLSPVLAGRASLRTTWWGEPRCHLRALTPGFSRKLHRPPISPQTLSYSFITCSQGRLVLDAGDRALLVDVFTGDEIVSPQYPPSFRYPQTGILTAPTSSESCTLVCVGNSGTLFWRLAGNIGWTMEPYLRYMQEVSCLALFNGLLYCLDQEYRVKAVNFDLPVSWTTLELPDDVEKNFGRYLVECGGELLLVLFVGIQVNSCRIDVYRLDFLEEDWVKKEQLGDWCLFVDVAGNSPMAFPNPGRWGGRSNCVYVAGSGYDVWSVYPMDGSEMFQIYKTGDTNFVSSERWPMPVWVYPSKLL